MKAASVDTACITSLGNARGFAELFTGHGWPETANISEGGRVYEETNYSPKTNHSPRALDIIRCCGGSSRLISKLVVLRPLNLSPPLMVIREKIYLKNSMNNLATMLMTGRFPVKKHLRNLMNNLAKKPSCFGLQSWPRVRLLETSLFPVCLVKLSFI